MLFLFLLFVVIVATEIIICENLSQFMRYSLVINTQWILNNRGVLSFWYATLKQCYTFINIAKKAKASVVSRHYRFTPFSALI